MSDNNSDNNKDEKKEPEDPGFSNMLDAFSEKNKENSFEYLLDSYVDGMNEDVKVGDKIKGEIISIGRDTVFLDTKTKIDGAVEKSELLDENGEFPYEKGDMLELYIVSASESEIILSKALSGIGGLNLLIDAFDDRVPVEGKVAATCKGGFQVEISGKRAFCPISQMDLKFIETPDDYIGQVHVFLIKTFEDNGRNIVVSRRELLEKELAENLEDHLKNLKIDSIIEGRVTNIMPYGAFVELIPGLEGMAHISELSWSRVEKPEEVLKKGDTVKVKVLGVEKIENSKSPKISLSIKQATIDPWDSINENFKQGSKVTGTVTRIADFGAFVEIAPGLEGLVHISEMSYLKRVVKTEDVVKPGETVGVMIKSIDADKKRISLSMKDAEGDPWIDAGQRFKIGVTINGTVERKENFGYFVALMPGITGLLPKSKISKSYDPASIEKLKEGDAITVKVEEINPKERRITLDVSDSTQGDGWKEFSKGQESPMGDLGEKLMRALKDKE
jgi:small subunit ribosomal protein S1